MSCRKCWTSSADDHAAYGPGNPDRAGATPHRNDTPVSPSAGVLALHGGASRRDSVMVSPTQLSVLRMVPIARRVARVGRGQLAVFRLLNATRGWDTHHTPVADARWALQFIGEQLGDLPVGLIGHSLGGRAALLAAGEPSVRSVVALAPWVYPTDNPGSLAGRRILVVHGSADRVASPQRSFAVSRRLARSAAVGYIQIDGAKHACSATTGSSTRSRLASPPPYPAPTRPGCASPTRYDGSLTARRS
jgi:predicted esterase